MPFNKTTEAYLMGIRDERELLQQEREDFDVIPPFVLSIGKENADWFYIARKA